MIRLFEQHRIRVQKELEGIWRFVREDGREYDLPVPGCWEQHPELLNYRGKGTFYKKLYLREKTNVRLEFKGVSHTAEVFWDDEHIAYHYNAYTGFDGVVKEAKAGWHMLRVEVDNTFGGHSALHIPNDYYTYGGLIRPVVLEELKEAYLKRVHFTPYLTKEGWFAKITVLTENLSTEKQYVRVNVSLAGKELTAGLELAPAGSAETVWEQRFEAAEEWNTESPKLYFIETRLEAENGALLDDYIDRVGFRQVSIEGNRLLLNNRPVFLKGFNRHEDYGTIGSALPLQLMVQDMDMMQEVYANAVRTCHYPNDERFLDLCDERGMLVWEENHARGLDLEHMQHPNFEKQCADCIKEMLEQHHNHPAIVIWGILNECASETPEGREMYGRQYEQIRQTDASRPVTSATCRHFTDICLDMPDIVSFNMYSGWYQDVSVRERHEQEMEWINKEGGAGKPVIVSEFGAAAMYGYRDRGRCKWSEERQADLIRENLEVYREDERLTGVFIWQFADCKVTEEGWFATRARCHNNKGVVDEYRRPKEAFDVVKELFLTMNQTLS